jgi:hypothetical protein
MRTQISNNLKRRSQAIRTAINKYNAACLALTPPKPVINWEQVSHYGFLQDVEFLHDSKADLTQKPWADQKIHYLMKQYQHVERCQTFKF